MKLDEVVIKHFRFYFYKSAPREREASRYW